MNLSVVAIDPGPEKSAVLFWSGAAVNWARIIDNDSVLCYLRTWSDALLVIEKIASFGMPVGAEVFETVYWSGRFAQAYGADRTHRITRIEVKNHICHSSKAKDSNIRQALIDRFGGASAIGTKKQPGPLYGIKADLWSALALAVTFSDRQEAAAA